MKTEFVVQIFLNIQFHRKGQLYGDLEEPSSSFDKAWVQRRIELFEKSTLKSLENQSFQDFRIWILCGQDHMDITGRRSWPKRVEAMHDNGERAISRLNADYLSITRLDSDDLFHFNVMREIRDNQIHTDKRECLILRKCWQWDRPNRFMHDWQSPSGPFFTHIFPRRIYGNWRKYTAEHFLHHGKAGGLLPGTKELPAKLACIVKHRDNHRYRRRGIPVRLYDKKKLEEIKGNGAIFKRNKIATILKDFGIEREEVLRDWQ